jgi:ApaG protein
MYISTTSGVKVEVIPVYQEDRSKPEKKYYYWSFDIVIHNLGDVKIYLTSRHWIVHDENNKLYEIHGSGVNGGQPMIKAQESFTHASGCPLATPSGRMRGIRVSSIRIACRSTCACPNSRSSIPMRR